MKRNIPFLLIVVFALSVVFSAFARESVTFNLDLQNDDPEHIYFPDKGSRSRIVMTPCVIDFDHFVIVSSILQEDIISYELWAAENDNFLATFTDASSMVEYLSTLSGSYRLKIVTDTQSYIGSFDL